MEILEILKYVLPATIVLLASYLTIKSFLEKDERKLRYELNLNNQKIITPLKLQAYERIILLLERITPDALLVRVASASIDAKTLQSFLLMTIRQEFEHNLSQQIYVSPHAWDSVRAAKESIIKLINTASMRTEENTSSMEYSRMIIEMYIAVEESPITYALETVKNEVHELL